MTLQYTNIAMYLSHMANINPSMPAVICLDKKNNRSSSFSPTITFNELETKSSCLGSALLDSGFNVGTRTLVMVKPCPDFFVITFALFKIGAIPVLIDPGMGLKHLKKCIENISPDAFIGITKAHFFRTILGWGKKSIKTNVWVGRRLFGKGFLLDELLNRDKRELKCFNPSPDNETAAILFTSGSTGPPKGVVYSHKIFVTQIATLKKKYAIKHGEIDIATFPLFGLFDAALGMTAIIPEMNASKPGSVDPEKIISAIKKYRATNMFGSPALIDRVGKYAVKKSIKLDSLKRVISAGAPVSSAILKNFSSLLNDGTQIYTPYGATEALPVCSIGSREILKETSLMTSAGAGVCVGTPLHNITICIISISDEPIITWTDDLVLKQGEIGEIVVQGDVVTTSYFNLPDHTKLSKIYSPDKKSFYHRMGDLGYFDANGRLWFCGRKSHRVITEKETLYTIPCEAIFNTHVAVRRTALVGAKKEEKIIPVICVELIDKKSKREREQIKRELLDIGAKSNLTGNIHTIMFHNSFPVDIRHNAKIFREKLAIWATRKL